MIRLTIIPLCMEHLSNYAKADKFSLLTELDRVIPKPKMETTSISIVDILFRKILFQTMYH
jgi:hypothetical protein